MQPSHRGTIAITSPKSLSCHPLYFFHSPNHNLKRLCGMRVYLFTLETNLQEDRSLVYLLCCCSLCKSLAESVFNKYVLVDWMTKLTSQHMRKIQCFSPLLLLPTHSGLFILMTCPTFPALRRLYGTVMLTTSSMLYSRSLELAHLAYRTLYACWATTPISPPPPSTSSWNHHSIFCFCEFH